MCDKLYINKNKFDNDEGQHHTVFNTLKDAQDDVSRPFDYEYIGREYINTDKINRVLQWCDINIKDETLVSSFAVQIRDYLENA